MQHFLTFIGESVLDCIVAVLLSESIASSSAAQLIAGPSNLTVLAGETVRLECAVSMPSSRNLHVVWSRQGNV